MNCFYLYYDTCCLSVSMIIIITPVQIISLLYINRRTRVQKICGKYVRRVIYCGIFNGLTTSYIELSLNTPWVRNSWCFSLWRFSFAFFLFFYILISYVREKICKIHAIRQVRNFIFKNYILYFFDIKYFMLNGLEWNLMWEKYQIFKFYKLIRKKFPLKCRAETSTKRQFSAIFKWNSKTDGKNVKKYQKVTQNYL